MSTEELAQKIRNLSIYTKKDKTELKNELKDVLSYKKKLYGKGKSLSDKLKPSEKGVGDVDILLKFLTDLSCPDLDDKKILINKNLNSFNKDELFILDFIIHNRSTTSTGKVVHEKFKIHSFKSYNIESDKPLDMNYPVYVQHKLDGMRLYITYDGKKVGAFSKNFTDYIIPSSIKKELDKLAPVLKKAFKSNFIIEGEIHGKNRSKCNGLLRKKEMTDEESLLFNLDLWDIFPYDVLDVYQTKKSTENVKIDKDVITYTETYKKRYNFLKMVIERKGESLKLNQISILPSVECENFEQVKKIYLEKTGEGAEGVVVKPINAFFYLGSARLDITTKLKARFDATLKFLEFKKGKAVTNSDYVGAIVFSSSDGIVQASISNFKDENLIPWNDIDLKKAEKTYEMVKIYFYGINAKNKAGNFLLQNAHLATDLEVTQGDIVDSSDKILEQFSSYMGEEEVEDEETKKTIEKLLSAPGRKKEIPVKLPVKTEEEK